MPVRGKQLAVRSSGAGFQIWSLTLLLHILIYTKLLNFSQPQSPHPQGRTNSNIFVRKVRWRLNGNLHYSHDLVPAAAKLLRSCPTRCDPIDGSPPGCPVPGILQGKNTGVGCHFLLQCMKVKSESEVAQSCLTLSDPMDRSLPGSSNHGIFQARVLEWGAIAFSRPSA